jgi:hypothetical protein
LAVLLLSAAVATPALADYAYTPGYGYSTSVTYAQPAYPQPNYAQPNYEQAGYAQPTYPAAIPMLNSAQIDQLTASIALYPDPLLAQVLTAASAQQDILAAAQYQQRYPNVDDYTLSLLPWDPSVKNLMRYPTVLQTLAQYPQWSATLGTAFTYQQADVLNSIQRLRIQAQLAGTLIPTPQQQVIVEQSYIRIQPVTQVIYVPRYDPCTVYLPQPRYASNAVAFGYAGSGFAFNLEFDWNNHKVQHNNDSHYGNDGQRYGNDAPRYSNNGPRNDGPRGNDNRNDSRPAIVQQQPPQGQRIVNAVPATASQRDSQPQARIMDQHPITSHDAARVTSPVVTQPVARQPVLKTVAPQRDDARPAQAAAPQVVAKQQAAPKSAAEQHKEDQDRKLLAFSRL